VFDSDGSALPGITSLVSWIADAICYSAFASLDPSAAAGRLTGILSQLIASTTQPCSGACTISVCSGIAPLSKQGVVVVSIRRVCTTFVLSMAPLVGRVSHDTSYARVAADSASSLVFAGSERAALSQCTRGPGSRLTRAKRQQQRGLWCHWGLLQRQGSQRIRAPSLSCPPPLASAPHTSLWEFMASQSCVCCRCPASPSCTRTGWRGCRCGAWQPIPGARPLLCVTLHLESTHVLAWPLPGMPQLE